MTEEIVRKPRHFGHKLALGGAGFCGLMMLVAMVAFGWMLLNRGMADTWTPSMAAVVAFFGCCAGVLYATSVPQPLLPPEGQVHSER
jgi:hypothetical protein